jgi:hypothetical protein
MRLACCCIGSIARCQLVAGRPTAARRVTFIATQEQFCCFVTIGSHHAIYIFLEQKSVLLISTNTHTHTHQGLMVTWWADGVLRTTQCHTRKMIPYPGMCTGLFRRGLRLRDRGVRQPVQGVGMSQGDHIPEIKNNYNICEETSESKLDYFEKKILAMHFSL